MRRAAFIYSKDLSELKPKEDHPVLPTRIEFTHELLEAYDAFSLPGSSLITPQPATKEDLLLFHSQDYVDAVAGFSRGEMDRDPLRYNFSDYGDNPIYPGMYEVSVLATGATLTATDLVLQGKADVAFNAGGGFHHAARSSASGFCIFNDAAVALKKMLRQGLKVAYIDIDCHHGDGVQNAFYDTDQVLTISIHQSGQFLFPGTGSVSEIGTGKGKGYAVNIPLYPQTDDSIYLWAFKEIVPPLINAFKPDIIVSQLGTDTHNKDPLTNMALTTQGFEETVKVISGLADRWVALGGGGYELAVAFRAWTIAYGVMLGKDFPDEIPLSFHQNYGIVTLRDHEQPIGLDEYSRRARPEAVKVVTTIKKNLFPLHGLTP